MCSVQIMTKTALKKADKSDPGTTWEWTDKKEKALELILVGLPKVQIARQLDVHRNTINNWTGHPVFIARAQQQLREHAATTRTRRMMETTSMANRVAKLAQKALQRAEDSIEEDEDGDVDLGALSAARQWMAEYRLLRGEERTDFGDDVKRVEHRGAFAHVVGGEVEVKHTTHDASFKDFLHSQLSGGIIDVDAIDIEGSTDEAVVLAEAVQHALIDGDILDIIDEEDRELEEATRS